MKKMRRMTGLLLTAIMTLSLGMTAFATNGVNENQGTITINNANEGKTYEIYRIFDLESYDTDKGAYSYTVNDAWSAFINQDTIKGKFVNVNETEGDGITDGYVTWVDNADAAAFAAEAIAYAKANDVAAVAAVTEDKSTEEKIVTFENLPLGYYLVDSSAGVLCSLNTTATAAEITEKNGVPTNEKEVYEDDWGKTSDGSIGDVVPFRSTITATKGAENYVFHDKMDDGLTFNPKSVVITRGGVEVDESNYTLLVEGTEDDEYGNPAHNGCTFEIVFDEEFCASLCPDNIESETIVVSYEAVINANAVIKDAEDNTSYLSYGDDSYSTENRTPDSTTKTYTWGFNVLKYTTNETGDEVKLADAEFVLYRETAGAEGAAVTKEYAVLNAATDEITGWTTTDTEATTLKSDAEGSIIINGLDSGEYFLEETKAPAGYNKLDAPIPVTIEAAETENEDTGVKTLAAVVMDAAQVPLTNDTVKVLNKAGLLLPSTGGIGTTVFYVAGAILMLGAVVVMIAKKRSA